MINWRIRLRNKIWLTGVISEMFIIIQLLLYGARAIGLTEYELSNDVEEWIIGLVNSVFALTAALTRVVDPTTKGWKDSPRAVTYKSLD